MVTLMCDPQNLQIVGDAALCSQWVVSPAGFFSAMTNEQFKDFANACMKLVISGFLCWWLVWAARRF